MYDWSEIMQLRTACNQEAGTRDCLVVLLSPNNQKPIDFQCMQQILILTITLFHRTTERIKPPCGDSITGDGHSPIMGSLTGR